MLTVSQWLYGLGMSQYESHFMNTGEVSLVTLTLFKIFS